MKWKWEAGSEEVSFGEVVDKIAGVQKRKGWFIIKLRRMERRVVKNDDDISNAEKSVGSLVAFMSQSDENSEEVVNVFWNSLTSWVNSLEIKNKIAVLSNMNGGAEDDI